MPDNQYTQIIDAAATDNGLEIRNTFDNLMIASVQGDIEARKVEIAKQMFAGNFDMDGEEEVEADDETIEEPADDEEEVVVDLSDDEIEDFLNTINNIENEEEESDENTA